MENLYIEMLNGTIPIDKKIAEKQKLEKGMITPFTCNRIVGDNNDFPPRKTNLKDSKAGYLNEADEATENVMLSTSEILDFAEGLDSHTED